MTVMIKICGLREERHVAAALEAGANAIGFVFVNSPRQITPQAAAALCASNPASVTRVAVMRHPSNDEWQRVLEHFKPDVLQTDANDFATLEVPKTIATWPVYRQCDDGNADNLPPLGSGAFVYEGQQSGQGETVSWPVAASVATRGDMILAGGLDADNVGAAIATVKPFGVDVSSGVESSRGVKSTQRILDFIAAVRASESQI